MLGAFLVGYVVLKIVVGSPFGRALGGIRGNEERMSSLGYDVTVTKLAVFTFAGAVAGYAGALACQQAKYFSPDEMSFGVSAVAVVVIVIGGQRTLIGAVLGAAFYYVIRDQLSGALSSHWQLALGIVFVLVVYLLPGGLVAGGQRLRRAARTMTPVLELTDIGRRYGELRAVEEVTLEVEAGSRHALIGPNGAGKSTLFNLISGTVRRNLGARPLPRHGCHATQPHTGGRDSASAERSSTRACSTSCPRARTSPSRRSESLDTPTTRCSRPPACTMSTSVPTSCWGSSGSTTSETRRPDRCRTATAVSSRWHSRSRRSRASCFSTSRRPGCREREAQQFMAVIGGLPQELTLMIVEHDMDVVFELATMISVLDAGRPDRDRPARRDPHVGSRPGGLPRARRPDGAAVHVMTPLLEIRGVRSGYDQTGDVLQGIDLDLHESEVVALLGRNGAGKTTLVNTIVGIVRPRAGSIRLEGRELAGRGPHEIARAGIAIVPQGRRIFARLTVDENLKLARRASKGRPVERTLEDVYELLPRLRERSRHRGNELSGGEQQMVAIGRALLANPRVLLFDEPSEGLAPRVVDLVTETIAGLRERGLSAIVVEQNLHVAFALADRVAIMTKGEIAYRATTPEFRGDRATAYALLGVS